MQLLRFDPPASTGRPPRLDALSDSLGALAPGGARRVLVEIATALWSGHLRHNPANPDWIARDRFVVCGGPAAGLLAALHELTGYRGAPPRAQVPPLRYARQAGTHADGRGFAAAVSIALDQQRLADEYNRPGHRIVEHLAYVLLDAEYRFDERELAACKLAGARRLANLIALCGCGNPGHADDPDWRTGPALAARMRVWGWKVIGPVDAHEPVAVGQAIALARTHRSGPCLILCRAAGYLSATAPARDISAQARRRWDARALGARRESAWNRRFAAYAKAHPDAALGFARRARCAATAEAAIAVPRLAFDARGLTRPVAEVA